MTAPTPDEERDFYRQLLVLGGHDDPEPLLRAALQALVGLVRAHQGYIELCDEHEGGRREWSASLGCDERRVDEIRGLVSRGIIAETLATGRVVATAAAIHDPRFADLESVQCNRIESVLCAPIGHDAPVGVVYVQGEARFDVREREYVELFARSLASLAERSLRHARAEAATATEPGFDGVIGRSAALKPVLGRLALAAGLDVTLLLTGASGTGKTMLANAVHRRSSRTGPFVELNCATIPDALLENELFGAEEGAHSAVPRGGVVGKVAAAEGGTLFLDEVGELSLSAQARLLQLLQSRVYYRLGGSAPRRANVRLIAATNLDLELAVREKRFREDLFYRLKVLEVRVPALAERTEDLVPLAAYFCREACERHGFAHKRLSPHSLDVVRTREWPGNVRELAHCVEAAVLDAHLRGSDVVEAVDFGSAGPELSGAQTLHEATRRFQRELIATTLESVDWNVREAARRLDVTRSHIYNLVRVHGLARAG